MVEGLLEIVEREPFILFDGNVQSPNSDFMRQIFPLKTFNQLNHEELKRELRHYKTFLQFVSSENVHTTREVDEEISKVKRIFHDKYKKFMDNKRRSLKKRYGKNAPHDFQYVNEKLFDDICLTTKEYIRITRKSIYKPNEEEYLCLNDCLVSLVEAIGIEQRTKSKKERYDQFGQFYFDRATRKEKIYLGTDEKLLSAAFYRSIFEESDAAIITRDLRFHKLIIYFTKLLSSKNIHHSSFFRERLREHPVRLYMPPIPPPHPKIEGEEVYELMITTTDVKIPHIYMATTFSKNGGAKLKERVNERISLLERGLDLTVI